MQKAVAFGVQIHNINGIQKAPKSNFVGQCKSKKVDLIMVLDTSGSVFHTFAEERKLALDFIGLLDPTAFEDGRLQVSVIRFSSSAEVKIPFKIGQNRDEIIEKLSEIQFTGTDTKISRAVELALAELSRSRRHDAVQIFILITDGYGLEFWHVVQRVGKKLQNAGAEIYAVSTSRDYNLAELKLYTGDPDRVYVGTQHFQFIQMIAPKINKCLQTDLSPLHTTQPSITLSTLEMFKADFTPRMLMIEKPWLSVQRKATIDIEKKSPALEMMETVTGKTTELITQSTEGRTKVRFTSDAIRQSTTKTSLAKAFSPVGILATKLSVLGETSTQPEMEEIPPSHTFANLTTFADSLEESNLSVSYHDVNGRSNSKVKYNPLMDGLERTELHEKPSSELEIKEIQAEKNFTIKARSMSENLDLLFIINRSPKLPTDLQNQLRLAMELIEKLNDEDINSERIRVGIISFAEKARLDLEWGNATNKAEISQHISSVKFTTGKTSIVAGIKLLIQYAEMARRPNTQLMIILISDGNSRDNWHTVIQIAKKLHELSNTMIYAVTTSKQYEFVGLETFTGNKRRVYTNGRTRRFLVDAGNRLIKGSNVNNEADNFTFDHNTLSQRRNDLVDLVILLDKSTSSDDDFEVSKKILEFLLRSIPTIDYNSRVRVALITFTDEVRTEFELGETTTKDDILYAIEMLQNEGGETSVPTAINVALSQIKAQQERDRRLVFIILTDGGSKDSMDLINATNINLQKTSAEVYIIPITLNYTREEIAMYAGDQGKLITNVNGHEEEFLSYLNLVDEKSVEEFVKSTREKKRHLVEDVTHAAPFNNQRKLDLGVEAAETNEIITNISENNFPFTTSGSKAHLRDPNCEIDLMFVVDKSQSVENIFQKQLQFAVALVNRIPPHDFNSRVRVASISFNSQAQVNFRFDEFNNQTEILQALLSITHTGGSTSAVSGVHLAVEEFQKTGRKEARRIVVLISDGNSQDEWENLLNAANRLHAIGAIVYAITASHNYYFRELELYAGNKWLVYVDGRKNQFLDDVELLIMQCQSLSTLASLSPQRERHVTVSSKSALVNQIRQEASATSKSLPNCKNKLVDLLFIIDSSTSVENDFNVEKALVLKLIKLIPAADFLDRVAVAIVRFNETGEVQLGFGKKRKQGDILYVLEGMERTGGRTSLVAGTDTALFEIAYGRRPTAQLVIVIVSDGNSQDIWQLVQSSGKKLRKTGGEIYAVSVSKEHNVAELEEYVGSAAHVYTGNRIDSFIEDISGVILNCNVDLSNRRMVVTMVPFDQERVTSPPESVLLTAAKAMTKKSSSNNISMALFDSNDLKRDEKPVVSSLSGSSSKEWERCHYSKMDLEIILDASTSRQQVFEHQRELALSLIERLPIDGGETHVAIGINSFDAAPTLRQTLGLGQNKEMVRRAIEDIKYNGGSTFTAQAVELSVHDLERGRRPDAIQVVILMNDGMSQDPWEKVLEASQHLQATGAELFGVALGEKIDLRELREYIGRDSRIYRDNTTERFLTDVVSLLTGTKKCNFTVNLEEKTQMIDSADQICNNPNLDLIVLFDNVDDTATLNDSSIPSNRYLLLDILGSLPAALDDDQIKISLITFNSEPRLVFGLNDKQSSDIIFTKVESIEGTVGKPSYAKAVSFAVREYNKGHRPNARGILVIVGDGQSFDDDKEKDDAIRRLSAVKKLSTYAVDSRKKVDVEKLSQYTSSPINVFNYDRNAEFARIILNAALAPIKAGCTQTLTRSDTPSVVNTSVRHQWDLEREKDVANKWDLNLKQFEGNKLVAKEEKVVTGKSQLSQPTTRASGETTKIEKKVNPVKLTLETTTVIKEDDEVIGSEWSRSTDLKKRRISSSSPMQSTSKATIETIFSNQSKSTTAIINNTVDSKTTFFGCEIDVIIIIDSSGSVEETFSREKELAAGIISRLRIGSKKAHVAIIKFAAKEKVKTVWSFNQPQEKHKVLQALQDISFSSGTTAIHSALSQAVREYSSTKGARPETAIPVGIIFTDGFGQKDTTEAANLLRKHVPNMFAVAVNHQYPISKAELEKIAGSKERVFTDDNIDNLYSMLEKITRTC